jgi:hypothetical protein
MPPRDKSVLALKPLSLESIALVDTSVLASSKRRVQARCGKCSKSNSKAYKEGNLI